MKSYLTPLLMLVFATGTCALLVGALNVYCRRQIRRKKRERAEIREDDFVTHFRGDGIEDEVAKCVYTYFVGLPGMDKLPALPGDSIGKTYYVGGEELDEAYAVILRQLGRVIPRSKLEESQKVETLEELVVFIAGLPISP